MGAGLSRSDAAFGRPSGAQSLGFPWKACIPGRTRHARLCGPWRGRPYAAASRLLWMVNPIRGATSVFTSGAPHNTWRGGPPGAIAYARTWTRRGCSARLTRARSDQRVHQARQDILSLRAINPPFQRRAILARAPGKIKSLNRLGFFHLALDQFPGLNRRARARFR